MKLPLHLYYSIILTLPTILMGCGNSDKHLHQGYVEGQNIYLASPYSGALVESLVERGQTVKKGELLFKLDPNPQDILIAETTAELEQAQHVLADVNKPRRPEEIAEIEAQLGEADAELQLAALRVKRAQTLYDKHVTPKDNLDETLERYQKVIYLKAEVEAKLKLAKIGAREDQIKAQRARTSFALSQLNQTKWQLTQKSIFSPAEGVIFDTYYQKGEFVIAQRPIASLLSPDSIRIEFFVPASELSILQVGQKITFDCDGCDTNNQAVVRYISPAAEYVPPLVYSRENRDKLVFRIKATISNPTKFKPGQPVVVKVSKNA